MKNIIGQHFFIGLSGHALTNDEKQFIVENNIGGICLFGRNVAEPKQVADLCNEIQSLRFQMKDKAPLFIGIDMEGGRVHRLKKPFTQFPAVKYLGDLDNPTVTFNFALRMGLELRAVGINLDFAPCADIFSNPLNTVIGDRSFGTDPELVARHVSAMIRGYTKSNVITCSKHFPGHGNTLLDSHYDLPVEKESTWEALENRELVPFRKAVKSRTDMVMSAHIKYPLVDPEWPATLSKKFITEKLRGDLRYRGFIITDDLGMKAMADNYGVDEIPVRAIEAGVDFLLYCNEPETPPVAYDAVMDALVQGRLSEEQLRENHRRILEFKKEKLQHPEALPMSEVNQLIGSSESLEFVTAIREGRIPTDLIGAAD